MIYLELEATDITAIERADLISSELLKISRPNVKRIYSASKLFGTIDAGDKAYLCFSLDFEIKIYRSKSTAILFSLIGKSSEIDASALAASLATKSTIKFSELLLSTAVIRSYDWMVENKLIVIP
jgi:hypothetical protein